ncbi:LOW QUALITY PROTEIN: DUF1399 domain-containing protein, partial [Cephalotus follicularis]
VKMENQQNVEWAKAQKIIISEDLVAAAKQQLKFLAVVDRNRHLYSGPALDQAIYRYKYCWLPLLAKHGDSQVSGPLVVPLDCEWVWHCHRLNPVRYQNDCKQFYGRILDNKNVLSSVDETFHNETVAIWDKMFPSEPYELNVSIQRVAKDTIGAFGTTDYDLVWAVQRQSSFFYQVSRPYMSDDLFLEEAVARYKGFLHLVRKNGERSIRHSCVPTYDIDLIWHSHQLHPVSYAKDVEAVTGKMLEHDDTDSDRTKGKKLDMGFSGTKNHWEETFGSRYWKAGAMHRGSPPSPLKTNLSQLDIVSNKGVSSNELQGTIQLHKKMMVEVMVEIVEVRNLLDMYDEGSLFGIISKKQPDMLFKTKRITSILSKAGERNVIIFQCEPTGDLFVELMSNSGSTLPSPINTLGTASISLKDLVNPLSQLSVENWFELMPGCGVVGAMPIHLRIAISFTPPVPAPYELHMVQPGPFSGSCFLPVRGRFQHTKSKVFADEAGNEIISVQMRDMINMEAKNNGFTKKEVIGINTFGETHMLALVAHWSLMNSNWLLIEKDNVFELRGNRKVCIFPGAKLEYETKTCEKLKHEQNFMTAVEFSAEYPYGKAVAFLNLKSGFIKINEEWLVLPGIVLAFLLSDTSRKEGYNDSSSNGENKNDAMLAICGGNGWGGCGITMDQVEKVNSCLCITMDQVEKVKSCLCITMDQLEVSAEAPGLIIPEKDDINWGVACHGGGGCSSSCTGACSGNCNGGGCKNDADAIFADGTQSDALAYKTQALAA